DDARSVLASLPDVVGGDRRALGDVRAADPHHLGPDHVRHGVRRAVDAERLLVPGSGAHHAEPAIVVDVARLHADTGELPHPVGLLGGEAGAGQDADGIGAVRSLAAVDLARDAGDCLVVGHLPEAAWSICVATIGVQQPVGVVVLEVARDALGAELAL